MSGRPHSTLVTVFICCPLVETVELLGGEPALGCPHQKSASLCSFHLIRPPQAPSSFVFLLLQTGKLLPFFHVLCTLSWPYFEPQPLGLQSRCRARCWGEMLRARCSGQWWAVSREGPQGCKASPGDYRCFSGRERGAPAGKAGSVRLGVQCPSPVLAPRSFSSTDCHNRLGGGPVCLVVQSHGVGRRLSLEGV